MREPINRDLSKEIHLGVAVKYLTGGITDKKKIDFLDCGTRTIFSEPYLCITSFSQIVDRMVDVLSRRGLLRDPGHEEEG